jgi:hypothetical protein
MKQDIFLTNKFSFACNLFFFPKARDHVLDPYISSLYINPLTPELNPSAQRCLTRFFTGDFASLTVNFANICVKNQQIHQLFIQFINYIW